MAIWIRLWYGGKQQYFLDYFWCSQALARHAIGDEVVTQHAASMLSAGPLAGVADASSAQI